MKHDYIEFDDFGVKHINCMICGVMIGKRTHVPVEDKMKPGDVVEVMGFNHFNSCRRVPFELENGKNYIEAFVCSECDDAGELDMKEIERQIHKGYDLGAIHRGKPTSEVKKTRDFVKLKKRKVA